MSHTRARLHRPKQVPYGGEGDQRKQENKPPRQPDSSPKKPGDSAKDNSPPDIGQGVESG